MRGSRTAAVVITLSSLAVAGAAVPATAAPGTARAACVATAERRAAELRTTADQVAGRSSADETTEAFVVARLRAAADSLARTGTLARTVRANQVARVCRGVATNGRDAVAQTMLFLRIDDQATARLHVGEDLGSLASALPPSRTGYVAWRVAYDAMRMNLAEAGALLDQATGLVGRPTSANIRRIGRLTDLAAVKIAAARTNAASAKAAAGL
jgi:hypothetical protein